MNRPTVCLLDREGAPVKVQVQVRASESMPSRIKVHFRTDERKPQVINPENGEAIQVKTARGALCPEFRLEMN